MEKAALSFSLRPSHKQQPGFEYNINFLEEEEEYETTGDHLRRRLKETSVFLEAVAAACPSNPALAAAATATTISLSIPLLKNEERAM